MTIHASILDTIGNTPLVRINHAPANLGVTPHATVLGKLEFFNPGASVKDRIANAIVQAAEESGALQPGGTIVEGTSGNTGIGLAMVGAAKGYKVVIAMPESMSKERRSLLRAFGAELILTSAAGGMKEANATAERIAQERGGVLAQQFANPANAKVHYATTGPEIWRDTEGKIDILVAGIGTGGTITGAGRYLKDQNPAVRVVAVEPAESPVLSGGQPGPHKIQGIGAGFDPEVLDNSVYDEIVQIDSETALQTAREVSTGEGVLVGVSAGAALSAAFKLAALPEHAGKTIVAIVPDFGERYLSAPLHAHLADD